VNDDRWQQGTTRHAARPRHGAR